MPDRKLRRHVAPATLALGAILAGLPAVAGAQAAASPEATTQPSVTASTTVQPAETPPADTSGLLTLRDCLRIALESSASLRVRDQEVDIAEQDVRAAWGALLPNLSASGSWNRSERTDFDLESPFYTGAFDTLYDSAGDMLLLPTVREAGTVTEDVTIRSTSKDWSLSTNLTLFDGLANVNQLRAARAGEEASRFSRRYTREQVIEAVAVAYYNLLRFTKLREVAAETRDQAAAELERTETYFRLGSAAKSDVLQQRVRLEQTKYDLVVADNQVEKAEADLAYAMNQPLARRLEVDTSPLETELVLENIEVLYAEALESRLDLRAAAADAEAADHRAAAATGALLPRLDIYARYSRSYNESPYRFGSQESESILWGGQISWDIFNRFQNWTGRSRARAQARIAEYQLEQTELDAQVEVRQYHNAMREAVEKHNVSTETVIQAEEELRLAKERFRVGAGTQLDRITAEVNLASARAEVVQSVCDYLIARVRLNRAVGRLSQLGRDLP
jgi:outer membrane protein TolC